MDNTRYFSRSWALITRDKGWIKPILVMAAATLVPIAGEFGNSGYALEYARLTAWGTDGAPKQKNVDIGACIKSGARGFVVSLGWGLAVGLITSIFTLVASIFPGVLGALLSGTISLASLFVTAASGIAIYIAQLRCAIYESIPAGYNIERIFELIKRDTSGFVKLFLLNLVCTLIIGIIGTILVTIIVVMFLPLFMSASGGYISEYEIAMFLSQSMVILLPVCVVFGFVISLLANAIRLVVLNAVGLWMRQFNVPAWGRNQDPLPAQSAWTQPYGQSMPQQPWSAPQQPMTQSPAPQPAPSPAPQPEPAPAPAPQPQPAPAPAPQPEEAVEAIPLVSVTPSEPEPDSDSEPGEPEEKTADEIYNDFLDALEENDHVDGD